MKNRPKVCNPFVRWFVYSSTMFYFEINVCVMYVMFACATCLRQTSLQSEIDDAVLNSATACESTVCGAKLSICCLYIHAERNAWTKWPVSWWRWWWQLLLLYFCIKIAKLFFPIPLWELTDVWLACRVQWNYQGHNRRHSCASFRQFNAFTWCIHYTHTHTNCEHITSTFIG